MKCAATILLLVQLLAKCLAVPHGHGLETCPTDSDVHHSRLHLHLATVADHTHDRHSSEHHEPGDTGAYVSLRSLIKSPLPPHDQDAVYIVSDTFVSPPSRIPVAECKATAWLVAVVESRWEGLLPRIVIARAAGPPGELAADHFHFLPHVLRI